MRDCRAPSCRAKAHGYSRYCSRHHKRNVRHGDPLQTGVKTAEIKPIKAHVARWLSKRSNADAVWNGMRDAWSRCAAQALAEINLRKAGRPGITWQRAACDDIVKVNSDAAVDEIILTVVAMAYHAAHETRRYASDRAFRFQVARRFRALTYVNRGERWNNKTGRVHRFYRDPSPRHAEYLGQTLIDALAGFGVAIQSKEAAEIDARQRQVRAALQAISESTGSETEEASL
jgi:hypothetical protein